MNAGIFSLIGFLAFEVGIHVGLGGLGPLVRGRRNGEAPNAAEAAVGRHDRRMACALLGDVLGSFRSHGINEWVGPFWPSAAGAPGYTASAASVYAASIALRA